MVKHDTKLITFLDQSISDIGNISQSCRCRRDLCRKCVSQLKLWVRIPLTTRCTRYNLMW